LEGADRDVELREYSPCSSSNVATTKYKPQKLLTEPSFSAFLLEQKIRI